MYIKIARLEFDDDGITPKERGELIEILQDNGYVLMYDTCYKEFIIGEQKDGKEEIND